MERQITGLENFIRNNWGNFGGTDEWKLSAIMGYWPLLSPEEREQYMTHGRFYTEYELVQKAKFVEICNKLAEAEKTLESIRDVCLRRA